MKNKNTSLLEIHLAVLLFGVSGLFGKLLALPSMIIVLGRVFFFKHFSTYSDLCLKERYEAKGKKALLVLDYTWGRSCHTLDQFF